MINAESGGSSVAAPLELKGYFLNMSHLYVTEKGQDTRKATSRIGFDAAPTTTSSSVPAPTRPISPTSPIFNVQVYQKQPQVGLLSPQQFGGSVSYVISGADAGRVHFVKTGPNWR